MCGWGGGGQAVVLACGDGRRLYPLTKDCSAPLLPVLNKPLLHYQLELLEKAGYTGALRRQSWANFSPLPLLRQVCMYFGF